MDEPRDDIAHLFARVAAQPGDLGAREVLADALQMAGDPRGEFIALQLAIASDVDGTCVDDSVRRRAAALLETHIDRWTGSLPEVVPRTRRFERGFLVALRTRAKATVLDPTLGQPDWATIEELAIECTPDLRALLASAPLLRTLAVPDAYMLRELAKLGPVPGIRTLACGGDWLPKDLAAFPNLSVLGGRLWDRGWHGAPVGTQHLEVLGAAKKLRLHAAVFLGLPIGNFARVIARRSKGPPELRFALGSGVPDAVDPCADLLGHGYGWRVRVPRDGARAELAWGGGDSPDVHLVRPIADALELAGISELAISVNGPPRATVREALAGDRKLIVRWERCAFSLSDPGPARRR